MFFGSHFFKIIFCATAFLFSVQAFGEKPLTIGEAVSEALQENPSLKAEEAKVGAYKAKVGVAKSLEAPMVGVEFFDVPLSTMDVTRGQATNYSIIQKFPFPGKLATKGKAAENEYLARRSFLDASRLDVVVRTEHAFHDLYFAQNARVINRELQGLWEKLVASEEARYTTGKNSSQNLAKAKVELDKLQSEAALLEAKEIQSQAILNILRHRNPSEPVHLVMLDEQVHFVPSYETFEKIVLEKHPEVKSADYQVASQKANVSLAKREALLPDFQTRFTYAKHYDVQDDWTGEVMINIPFFWGKNRKELREARAMEKASEQEALAVKDNKLADLKETYSRYESSKKVHELFYKQVLPHAAVAFQSARAAYESGKEDFLSLVDAAREFKEAKLGSLEALVEYHRAITHLKSAVGFDFTKENL